MKMLKSRIKLDAARKEKEEKCVMQRLLCKKDFSRAVFISCLAV